MDSSPHQAAFHILGLLQEPDRLDDTQQEEGLERLLSMQTEDDRKALLALLADYFAQPGASIFPSVYFLCFHSRKPIQ